MNQAITLEVRFFLVSILAGVILLVLYDILRILRIILKPGAIQIGIQDVLFWIAAGVFIFRMMYQMNDGIVRGFSVVGIFLGMLVYKYSISDWLVHSVSKGILTLFGWIRKVIKVLMTPFRFLLKQLRRFGHFLGKKIGWISQKIVGRIKKVQIVICTQLQKWEKSITMKQTVRKEKRRELKAQKQRKKQAEKAQSEAIEARQESGQDATEARIKREAMAVSTRQATVRSRVIYTQRK